MINQRLYYLLVCACILLGVCFDYYSADYPVESKTISVLHNGIIIKKDLINTSTTAELLKILALLAYTFGISIFVSVFVTAFIERNRAKELKQALETIQSAINIDVFDGVFKRLVPSEIFKSLKEVIVLAKIIRRNQHNIYDFEISGEDVKIRATLRNELENISENIVNDKIEITLSKDSASDRLVLLEWTVDDKTETLYDAGRSFTDAKVKFSTTGSPNVEKISVDFSLRKGQKISIIQLWEFYSKTNNTHVFWCSKYPLINIEVTANIPDGFKFEFLPFTNIPFKCDLNETRRVIYVARGGILPYQGFTSKLIKA